MNQNLEIVYRSVIELVPYSRNARTHSDEQVAQIAASIREFGFTNPILIDAAVGIIAGHGRVQAAHLLKLKQVPTITLAGLTEHQKRAYVIADNQLALNAGWNEELLSVEIQDLLDNDFDVELLGFSDEDLEALMRVDELDEETQERAEETPDIPENPVAVEGDLWILGDHRLICGSSTEAHVVEKLLGDIVPHLMVTDPPYGVEYDAEWRARAGVNAQEGPAHGKVLNDDNADWREAWALFPGDVAYVWHAGVFSSVVAESLMACEFDIRSQIIWAKSQFAMSRGHYHWQHEPCWYAVRQGKKGHWYGNRKQSTIWDIDKPNKSETGHSTQKPIDAMRIPLLNNSKRGDNIYEPFCGSGTTLIAAEMEDRHCYAVELNPAYIDVIIMRWQEFTKREAILDSDGRSFDEIKGERLVVAA